MKKPVFAALICLNVAAINAQSYNIGLKFFGINIHPIGDINAGLMPIKLGSNAFLVPSFGAMVSFEQYIWKNVISYKLVQSNYTDCTLGAAGSSHLGLRALILSKGRHELNGGIGPTLVYRKSWYRFDDYDDTKNFYGGDPSADWQWRFILYGGELEYNYNITKNIDFSLTVIPGIPILISHAFGIRIRR